MDAINIVVPHQANKNMVVDLSKAAGVSEDKLYFNIERVGTLLPQAFCSRFTMPCGKDALIGRCECLHPALAPARLADIRCCA